MRLLPRIAAFVIGLCIAAQAFDGAMVSAHAAATLLPNGEQCFAAGTATSGGSAGFITNLGSITGGASYVNGTYSNVPLTGGSGAGAIGTITVSGGAVTNVLLTNPGSHYVTTDVLSASNGNLGGSGSGFSVPVTAIQGTGTGMIGFLGTLTPGSGGTAGTYSNVTLTGGSGSNATANITVAGGAVTQVQILNPGVQYIVGDVLSANSGSIGGVSGFSVPVASITINSSLAGGKVYFYIPNTQTLKQTWFNADQASNHQNTNPVALDANGCAIIYGTGSYRQVLQDSLGDTVWDQITTDTSANNNYFWAGNATGTANNITVTDPGFNGTDGSVISFIAIANNTGATTLNPSGYFVSAPQILLPSITGPLSLTANVIATGNIVSVAYSASGNFFQVVSIIPAASATVAAVPPPQGYLTLSSDPNNVIITGDTTGATSVYYTPYIGNQVPIYNGVSFVPVTFSQLALNLTSSFSGNTIYDVCVFLNNGAPTLVGGPAWSNSSAGSGARGSGAGSAQISRVSGIWVNAVQITGVNGANTYTIPASQCTYVGSLYIDGTAGQVSNYLSWGQSRKWGVWNAYNRQKIFLQVGDSTANWNYSTLTWRPSNNATANSLTVFSGLAEEDFSITFQQHTKVNAATQGSTQGNTNTGIGYNSTTAPSGTQGTSNEQLALSAAVTATLDFEWTQPAAYVAAPSIGINTVTALEEAASTNTTVTFFGAQLNMLLQASWRG